MQNHYPLWKNILILSVFLISTIYSLPNLYGDDPSVQVSLANSSATFSDEQSKQVDAAIKAVMAPKAVEFDNNQVLARFSNTDDQMKVADSLRDSLGDQYTVALNLAPTTPAWLRAIGAQAMYLGLDLRGGVHFLLEVDMDAAVKQAEDRYVDDVRTGLRDAKVHYQSVAKDSGYIKVTVKSADEKADVLKVLNKDFRTLDVKEPPGDTQVWLKIKETEIKEIKKFAVEQNMTTLRNRVNELGVAEPVIQQQGENRIVIQLPGVQDTARAKEILGTTATLEYRLVDVEHDLQQAIDGHVPLNSRLYHDKNGSPYLLEKKVIVTGDQIVNAASTVDDNGRPAVSVTLNGVGATKMGNMTKDNVGRPMAVVFIEYKTETKIINGEKVRQKQKVEKIINVATIQGVFSKRFQTTGLDSTKEAQNLALLLRAGALAAPVDMVEERTVGPTLGADNIKTGLMSFIVGFALVVTFMAVYYRLFGLIANMALAFNIVIVITVLSWLQATLTLPGIAGIVLTVGMSVDANVLIFERVKEEIKNGNNPQTAIFLGYDKAFATILDSHFTNFVVAVVLFAFGTGTIKGFAVTLIIGIISSMFTAITGTRMVINWIYGSRRVEKLSI